MNYKSTYLKLADFGRELLSKTSLEEGLAKTVKWYIDNKLIWEPFALES